MALAHVAENPSNRIATYAKALNGHDELFGEDGQVLPHWMPFVHGFRNLSFPDLEDVRGEIRRQLRENGVTVHVHGDPAGTHRTWELDPVPLLVNAEDWVQVDSGLRQRATLLNAILEDLYDKRRLIQDGSLPMELVYRHPGFIRPCDGVRLPGANQLLLFAADLARGPDDRMWVVNDRTQAPSGSGYALENRSAMTRALPELFQECDTRRLARFFRTLRSTLSGFGGADPRIVVMTPGPLNETYFEHAYLAAYLGYTLVQGDDLTVRDSQVWLKSLGGLERVDVILRRVDEDFCDPLELRGESMLGVPGLLEAVRCGNVIVANPLGTGVLENPGLMAFLPSLCRKLLGEELQMPSAGTWWCGQEKALKYVLEHLDKLVIKRIYRGRDLGTVFGATASKNVLETLRQRIMKEPAIYVGQEQVSFSTMPCLVGEELEPRRGVLRAFLSADADAGGYAVMPGGLTRSAPDSDSVVVSSAFGGSSKDTWVIGDEDEPFASLWSPRGRAVDLSARRNLPSRTGENLFWAGRYAERVEGTARWLRSILEARLEYVENRDTAQRQHVSQLLATLFEVTHFIPASGAGSPDSLKNDHELHAMLTDPSRDGSLVSSLKLLTNSAYGARDLWSRDSWRVIDNLTALLEHLTKRPNAPVTTFLKSLDRLITELMALTGLNLESMTRETGWRLLDSGRRLERSQQLIGFLRATCTHSHDETGDYLMMESLLGACDSLVTYRRQFRSMPSMAGIIELLLLDENYARSLLYQVVRLKNNFAALPERPGTQRLAAEERLILQASTVLRLGVSEELATVSPKSGERESLAQLLDSTKQLLEQVSDVLNLGYFSHTETSSLLLG
ncbi:MAG: circularly permuted type 2 ATP-grasp protein [Verrucomicrobiales bacterium]|nr:circularly permuted type 2 ATP-grasp protein [Verrucomicrobiales bacterium]